MIYLEPFPGEIILIEHRDHTTDTQPSLSDSQVHSKEEIVVGKRYCKVYRNGQCMIFTVKKEPYCENGEWVIDVCIETASMPLEEKEITIALADCSVVPYKTGRWNAKNFLVLVNEK